MSTIVSRLDITQVFCDVDDFCKQWEQLWQVIPQLPSITGERRSRSRMSISEVMTIVIAFHGSGYRTFKEFYTLHVLPGWRGAFPNLVSYNRFVELMPWCLMLLCCFLHTRTGEITGISFIDSTPINVCHNCRAHAHKVFKGLVNWGKNSVGWHFGFKLHLIINDQGELLAFKLTSANVDDRKPVPEMTEDLIGKLFGDLHLKLIELDLQYELEDKKQQEQERDRENRKQNKEREAIDKARLRAEEAEERERLHQKEIDKIRQEIVQAKDAERKQLEMKIQELERLVAEDRSDRENALSETRRLKSGYIYIISNIGSLGRDMYRICMTSRSQEDLYIREMNPAVPFQFDVHFKIFSEDAVDTLQKLHQRFDDKRVNVVNSRRDFFQVSIDEIETAVKEIQKKSGVFLRIDEFEKYPQAYEYRQTLSVRKKHRLSNTNEEYSEVNEIA